MTTIRQAWMPNLSLAILLCAIVASWFRQISPEPGVLLSYGLLSLATLGLACLALLRPPARNLDDRWWVYLVCVVSMVYALGYRFDPSNKLVSFIFWSRISLVFLAHVSLLSLGKSYAMLPALRKVRSGLFYRYVRHPVYALYMLADLAVLLLAPSLWNLGIAALGAVAFYLRSRLEEQVLRHDARYAAYMRSVPWRFFPGVH
jgi:protein-S-isoprenylcysteine O-methyltransferase Ste14